MKRILILCLVVIFITGCGPSKETIALSEGIAVYQTLHHKDVMVLLSDPAIREKYPALVKKIESDGKALVNASHGLWLLLEGADKDEILK